MLDKTYSIGDLAKEFGVTTRAIRFYEQEGMLTPDRSGYHRVYTEKERVRLKLIVRGKRLGFSLSDSREIIELYEPNSKNVKQLSKLLEKVKEQRQKLNEQLDDIKHMQEELKKAEATCIQHIEESK